MKKNFKRIVIAAFVAMTVAGVAWAEYVVIGKACDKCNCDLFLWSDKDTADAQSLIKKGVKMTKKEMGERFTCDRCGHKLTFHWR